MVRLAGPATGSQGPRCAIMPASPVSEDENCDAPALAAIVSKTYDLFEKLVTTIS